MSAIPYHSDRIALKLRPLKTHPHRAPELRDGARTQALLERVNASRRVYLTHTVLDGRYTIRMRSARGLRNCGISRLPGSSSRRVQRQRSEGRLERKRGTSGIPFPVPRSLFPAVSIQRERLVADYIVRHRPLGHIASELLARGDVEPVVNTQVHA